MNFRTDLTQEINIIAQDCQPLFDNFKNPRSKHDFFLVGTMNMDLCRQQKRGYTQGKTGKKKFAGNLQLGQGLSRKLAKAMAPQNAAALLMKFWCIDAGEEVFRQMKPNLKNRRRVGGKTN